jgi:hypothetical protein
MAATLLAAAAEGDELSEGDEEEFLAAAELQA